MKANQISYTVLLFCSFFIFKSNAQDAFITTWKTDLPGGSNNSSITIPTFGTGYNYDVDWDNDGIFDTIGITTSISHDYGAPDTVTIRIRGDFPRIYFFGATDRQKLLAVNQWGSTSWTTMESAFRGCFNLLSVGLDTPDLSGVSDCSSMFLDCINFNSPIDHWDMSSVSDISAFFLKARDFNQPLNSWNVQRVKLMDGMFQLAEDFNQNLNLWVTDSVTNMSGMFRNAYAFDGYIYSWNVGQVTDMGSMFYGAGDFNQNLDQWEVDSVTDFSNMFADAITFNQNVGSWDISAGVQFENMLDSSGLSRTNYDSLLIGWARLHNGEVQIPLNGNLGATGLSYCAGDSARNKLINTYGWTITDEGKDCLSDHLVLTWITNLPGGSNDNSITIPTKGAGYNYDVDWNNDGIFDEFGITTSILHDYGAPDTVTIRIRGDFPRIYFLSATDREKLIAVNQWGSTPWTTMQVAFRGCTNLLSVGLDTPDLSGVSSCEEMFRFCSKFNSPIGHWDMSSVSILTSMFENADVFNQPVGVWDVGQVRHMDVLFSRTDSFNQPLNNWDVSNVVNMRQMFWKAKNFDQDLDLWQVDSVTNMSSLFLTASKFNRDISTWNVGHVINMRSMFENAESFNQKLNDWDVSNVVDMDGMFDGAISFNQDLDQWDVDSVENLFSMFSDATQFNGDITTWDTRNATDMARIFFGATSFNQNLSDWDISSAVYMNNMFDGSGLSTAKYDSILIGWARLDSGEVQIPDGRDLGAANIDYCIGDSARQSLIADHNWTITDGMKECSNTWTGTLSTDWFEFQNWSHGVPRSVNDVLIPVVGTNLYPVISSSGASCHESETTVGATLECELGWELSIGEN